MARANGIALVVNVGHQPRFAIPLPLIYFPMEDSGKVDANDWDRVRNILDFALAEIRRGGKVLVVCDAGMSRSVVVSAMLIALVEERPMDDVLHKEVSLLIPPLLGLWNRAQEALVRWRMSQELQ